MKKKKIKVRWPVVLDYNNLDERPIIRWIDLCNGTMFRIFAFFCHGGRLYPRIGLMVGIERCGSFLFDNRNRHSVAYVSEKLNISSADAAAIADWINTQQGFDDYELFGDYQLKYMYHNEPYGLYGETTNLPLQPEIIFLQEDDKNDI